MPLDVEFWNKTNETGQLVKWLSQYKPFDDFSYSVCRRSFIHLSVGIKYNPNRNVYALEQVRVDEIESGIFTLYYWGTLTAKQYKSERIDSLQDLQTRLDFIIQIAKSTDKRYGV